MMDTTVPFSSLRKIEPLNDDDGVRLEKLKSSVQERSCVCVCRLIYLFHIDKHLVVEYLESQKRFHFEKISLTELDEPEGEERIEPEFALYVAEGEPLAPKRVMEIAEATRDHLFAINVLRECFPGYRPGVRLKAQGEVGKQVGRALRGAVMILDELKLVPGYWKEQPLNTTAILISLRHVFGSAIQVRSFLRQAQYYYTDGIHGMVKEIEAKAEELEASTRELAASAHSAVEKLVSNPSHPSR
jgi:hypothetical protein